MTKYQNGELMEGWNDCPTPMLSRDLSTSSINSARSKKRQTRLYGLAPSSAPGSSPNSAKLSQVPPTGPVSSLSSVKSENSTPASVPLEDVPHILSSILQASPLNDRDKTLISSRVVDVFDSLDEQHKAFIAKIVSGLEDRQSPAKLKGEIVTYMMMATGVSLWCVPLKKLVELLKLA